MELHMFAYPTCINTRTANCVSKNKRFVLCAVGCVFDVVLKGFVETACLSLLGELHVY